MPTAWMERHSMKFFLKYNFLYAPMRYRMSEIQLQTFQYQDNSIPTWEFRGEKYLNTFIVTNVNDCPNLLSYGATFRMGVLLPNYPQEIVVKGENVPHFSKMNGSKTGNSTSNGTSNSISFVNTGNGTVSSTPNGTSNIIKQHVGKAKSSTVSVRFQYNPHSS